MTNNQIIIIIFITIVMILAVWNLVLSIQNMINENKFNKYKESIKELEKDRDYYGRLK